MLSETRLVNLVAQAQAGGREAFDVLNREFHGMVFAIVFRRLRNRSEAEEVTQEVFLRAFRKLAQLNDAERFTGWLKQIAVRMSINRAVRRPQEVMQPPENLNGVTSAPETPIDGVLLAERADQVRDGLQQLRPVDRETLLAFYFENQSLKEMSDRFSSPIGTIKRRLHTARGRLREALGDLQPA